MRFKKIYIYTLIFSMLFSFFSVKEVKANDGGTLARTAYSYNLDGFEWIRNKAYHIEAGYNWIGSPQQEDYNYFFSSPYYRGQKVYIIEYNTSSGGKRAVLFTSNSDNLILEKIENDNIVGRKVDPLKGGNIISMEGSRSIKVWQDPLMHLPYMTDPFTIYQLDPSYVPPSKGPTIQKRYPDVDIQNGKNFLTNTGTDMSKLGLYNPSTNRFPSQANVNKFIEDNKGRYIYISKNISSSGMMLTTLSATIDPIDFSTMKTKYYNGKYFYGVPFSDSSINYNSLLSSTEQEGSYRSYSINKNIPFKDYYMDSINPSYQISYPAPCIMFAGDMNSSNPLLGDHYIYLVSSPVPVDNLADTEWTRTGWTTGNLIEPEKLGETEENVYYNETFSGVRWDFVEYEKLETLYMTQVEANNFEILLHILDLPEEVKTQAQAENYRLAVINDKGQRFADSSRLQLFPFPFYKNGKALSSTLELNLTDTKTLKFYLEKKNSEGKFEVVSRYPQIVNVNITTESRPQIKFTNLENPLMTKVIPVDLNKTSTINGSILYMKSSNSYRLEIVDGDKTTNITEKLDNFTYKVLTDNIAGLNKYVNLKLFETGSDGVEKATDYRQLEVLNIQNKVGLRYEMELLVDHAKYNIVQEKGAMVSTVKFKYLFKNYFGFQEKLDPAAEGLKLSVHKTITGYKYLNDSSVLVDTIQIPDKSKLKTEGEYYVFDYMLPTTAFQEKITYKLIWTLEDKNGNKVSEITYLNTNTNEDIDKKAQEALKNLYDNLSGKSGMNLESVIQKYWLYILIGIVVFILIKRR